MSRATCAASAMTPHCEGGMYPRADFVSAVTDGSGSGSSPIVGVVGREVDPDDAGDSPELLEGSLLAVLLERQQDVRRHTHRQGKIADVQLQLMP